MESQRPRNSQAPLNSQRPFDLDDLLDIDTARHLSGRPPVTGAWREGDPPGWRKFLDVGSIDLEFGGSIPDVRVAYETWGTLNADHSNAVLILHALTGDAHVVGTKGPGQPTAGWWDFLVGPGKPIDTNEFFVICPNNLGGCQGTTGPSSLAPDGREWGSRFPFISIRDLVTTVRRLQDALEIPRWHTVVGPSMGGMAALELLVEYPDDLERCVVIAAPTVTRADHIARNSVQIQAVTADPHFRGGDYYDAPRGCSPSQGLSIARRFALTQYRSEEEFNARFGRAGQSAISPLGEGGRFAIESYLDYHGNLFTRRFDANSYVRFLAAINSHDLGRGRGGVEAALARATARTLVVGIDSDRLYRLSEQEIITQHVRHSLSGAEPAVIHSMYGHDAFLIEPEPLGTWVRELLASAPVASTA